MSHIIELVDTVERTTSALLAVPDIAAARRPAHGKWSSKEIIGHLIDSAKAEAMIPTSPATKTP